ncbi:FtsH protease activity modulator HflK [Vibrio parahaemolyticus]|nr:FtsH protease activity modulator HflK [Vibrio parahaemolyticus]
MINDGVGSSSSGKDLASSYKLTIVLSAALALIFGAWLVASSYFVAEKERMLVFYNGKYVETVGDGFHFLPAPFYTALLKDVSTVKSISVKSQALTLDENLVEVQLDLQFKIANLKAYYMKSQRPDHTLGFYFESVIKAVLADVSFDEALTDKRTIVKQIISKEVGHLLNVETYGVNIVDAIYTASNPPSAVKEAYRDAVNAREDAERYMEEAESYVNTRIPQAQADANRLNDEAAAYAKRVIDAANGEVAGFNQLLPQYLEHPRITKNRIYFEVMGDTYSKSKKVVNDIENSTGNNLLNHVDLTEMMKKKGL